MTVEVSGRNYQA